MARREKLRDLAIFERLHGNPAKSSANLAVKKVRHLKLKDLFLDITSFIWSNEMVIGNC